MRRCTLVLVCMAFLLANLCVLAACDQISAGDPTPTSVDPVATPTQNSGSTDSLPVAGKVEASIPLSVTEPVDASYGAGSLWVTAIEDLAVVRIDAGTGQVVSTIALPRRAVSVAASDSDVWVITGDTGLVGQLVRIDPASNKVVASLNVGRGLQSIALGDGSVWVGDGEESTVFRVDPASNQVTATIRVGGATKAGQNSNQLGLATRPGEVWVANQMGRSLERIDPRTNQVVETIGLDTAPELLAIAGDDLWIASFDESKLVHMSLTARKVLSTLTVDSPAGVVASSDALWVSLPYAGELVRVDSQTGRAAGKVKIAGMPQQGATALGAIWVPDRIQNLLVKVAPNP